MEKHALILVFTVFSVFAQQITLSKDSLKLYNNPVLSFSDEIALSARSIADPISLDSVYLHIDEMDTSGGTALLSSHSLEVMWRKSMSNDVVYIWRPADTTTTATYRLIHSASTTSDRRTIYFTESAPTQYIAMFEIGKCLNCSGPSPWYPPWFRGTLQLYFSNGQMVPLRLYSDDLRTRKNTEECHDYTCDSLSVRKILDANGMPDVPVSEVTSNATERILSLQLTFNPDGAVTLPKPVTILPEEIGNLTALRSLSLYGNRIDSISPHIGKCCSLRTIIANNNEISSLPDSFTFCSNLQYLSMENNTISRLPDSFGALKHLRQLQIRNNRLVTLPESLCKLDSLECLFISGNRICSLSDDVVQWVGNVHDHTICEMWEPAWPDSQDCSGTASVYPDCHTSEKENGIRSITTSGGSIVVHFNAGHPDIRSIALFTISGKKVLHTTLRGYIFSDKKYTITTRSLAPGIYHLRISFLSGVKTIRSLVITH